jgi:hypothetical protein
MSSGRPTRTRKAPERFNVVEYDSEDSEGSGMPDLRLPSCSIFLQQFLWY